MTDDNKYRYHAHKDWFDAQKWPKNFCPYFENICVYNQRLRVFKKEDEFSLKAIYAQKVFGDHMPNIKETLPIYLNVLNTTIWNKKENEYEVANCKYNDNVINHMIIHGYYQTMLGEWYARVLTELYRFYYYKNDTYTIDQEIKLYLFIGDQTPLYTSHHLFMQPFSKYNLQHFTNLIERIDCNCFKRLIFCGFQKEYDTEKHQNHIVPLQRMKLDNDDDKLFLKFGKNAPIITLYPLMIEFYNNWVNQYDIHIHRDTKLWKYNKLKAYLNNSDNINVDEWFFIGFYQRHYRRTWLFLETEILPKCNKKYNKYKIYCDSINLEGHLHPRDVVIMHRSFDLLIGIHGAHLTDSIWMYDPINMKNMNVKHNNKYIIELLPTNGPSWTASIHTPTALGIIFWQSKLNHVGLKLVNTSITAKDWKRGNARWYKSDFKVKWNRLTLVIDYLIIDDGGYCIKYNNNPKDIKVPNLFKKNNFKFAIYNAYCNNNTTKSETAWNFVRPSLKKTAMKCTTCSKLMYDIVEK